MNPERIVLDANVVISALIRPDSAPGRVLRSIIDGTRVQLITSDSLLRELDAALRYPRLRRYLKMSDRDVEEFVLLLEQIAEPVNMADHPAPGICRDPDDEPYLQTALAGRADYIVTGDKDLLDLERIEGIAIVSPAEMDRMIGGLS